MLVRQTIALFQALLVVYTRLLCIILSAAMFQGFVIVEIFVHSYTVVYPPYFSKHIRRFYSLYTWATDIVIGCLAAKTAMLGRLSRWLIRAGVAAVGLLVVPITHLLSLRRNRKCPPPNNPLLFHSATGLADMIRRRQITSEEVVQAYVERCREVNPYLNAIVEPRWEVALREARTIDAMLAASPERSAEELAKEYPLLGVPITVKESIAVEGMSNDAGCVKATRQPAARDATSVRLARAAGAVPIAVTNTPQLCMHWETYNNVTGLTRNPYDQRRTVGGSSGGEVALLASAASIVGIGSDIAGSLRLPSMFAGVYGHKPTPHIVSTEGHNPSCTDHEWDEYFSLGPLTRYAEDLPLMLKVLSDTQHSQLSLDKQIDIKKIRFCYMEGDTSGVANKIGADVKLAIKKVRDYFKEAHGIEVELVKINNWEHMWEISSRILMAIEGVENIYTDPQNPEKWLSIWPELIKKFMGFSNSLFTCVLYGPVRKFFQSLPKRQFKEIKCMLETLKKDFSDALAGDCVMFYPTFPYTAHVHYQVFYRFLNLSYLTIFNVLGLPVTNCPLGLTEDGLPVGLQIVAEKYNDHLTIAVAKELEKAFGGWVPPNMNLVSNGKLNNNES